MRLSEAILLGSLSLKPRPGDLGMVDEMAGCALGMAYVATGCTRTHWRLGNIWRDWRGVCNVYPWIENQTSYPCACEHLRDEHLRDKNIINISVVDVIVHLFDRHVFDKCDWTIERLAEWVASVEPQVQSPAALASVADPIDRLTAMVEEAESRV